MGLTNEEVKDEIENDEIGYVVLNLLNPRDINDPRLAELVAKAAKALNDIESYLGIE